jgi:ubiquinone/menaquinone biosynthesis C-methylase UbiE
MTHSLDALAREANVPTDHPVLLRERAFLEHWVATLLDPSDPQRTRWLQLELDQIVRNRTIAREVASFASLSGAHVLDVGCQLGALPIALSELGAHVTGVDVSDALLSAAQMRSQCYGATATFVRAEAERLPFADHSFDVVTFVDVIEHVSRPRDAVRELSRVLRPGGLLYLFGPNRFSPSNLRSDPHYNLAWVSAMPHAMGDFYVRRVRRFPKYEVGVLPVGGVVAQWLREDHCTLVHTPADDAQSWWNRSVPPWLHPHAGPARFWGNCRLNFASLFRLVARKHGV